MPAAPTQEARAAYDPHRLEAAIALGDPQRAVPALEASERDLPGDYNGPARLGIAYLELGRYDDALRRPRQRALKKVYGPRRLRVEETRATGALRKKGDVEGGARHAGAATGDFRRRVAAEIRSIDGGGGAFEEAARGASMILQLHQDDAHRELRDLLPQPEDV